MDEKSHFCQARNFAVCQSLYLRLIIKILIHGTILGGHPFAR